MCPSALHLCHDRAPAFLGLVCQGQILYDFNACFLGALFVFHRRLFLPALREDNKLIAAMAAGALYGVSSALFLKANGSSSGTDLLVRLLLTRRRSLTLGKMFLLTGRDYKYFSRCSSTEG
jgi:hypothetical protein